MQSAHNRLSVYSLDVVQCSLNLKDGSNPSVVLAERYARAPDTARVCAVNVWHRCSHNKMIISGVDAFVAAKVVFLAVDGPKLRKLRAAAVATIFSVQFPQKS